MYGLQMRLLALTLLIYLEDWGVTVSATLAPGLPNSIPLIVKSPYFHSWIHPNTMVSNVTRESVFPFFWSGNFLQWTSKITVDNTTTYSWMGDDFTGMPNLTKSIITPTRSIFVFEAGSIGFNATFLSPIDPSDLVRQSLPFGYVYIDAWSLDGNPHSIQIEFYLGGNFLSSDDSRIVQWNTTSTGNNVYHRMALLNPQPFAEDRFLNAIDSTLYFAMENKQSVTWQTGLLIKGRTALFSESDDNPNFGPILHTDGGNETYPILVFKIDLGRIIQTNESVVWVMGLVRDPVIRDTSFGDTQLRRSYYWSAYESMDDIIQDVIWSFDDVKSNSINLDNKILADGYAIPSDYDYLLSLSLRLTFGAMDITIGSFPNGTMDTSDVKIFMKDIGTSNRVNPVDILYASLPAILYLNSSVMGFVLEPLLEYQNSSNYNNAYAAPDLGKSYPNVTGNSDFNSKLAVESCSSMLIMTLAHASKSGDGTLLNQYYDLLHQWSQYLEQSGFSSTTTGFETFDGDTGPYLSNLVLKGILGIYAMSGISESAGRPVDSSKYLSLARNYTAQWKQLALSTGHITSVTDNITSTGGLAYNLYAARLLSAKVLIDDMVYTQQSQFYASQLASALTSDNVIKTHWIMFTAAAMPDTSVRNSLMGIFLGEIFNPNNKRPFPSTYDVNTRDVISGDASPAQGAMFALLTLNLTDRQISGFSPVPPTSSAMRSTKRVGATVGGGIAGFFGLCIVLISLYILRKRRVKCRPNTSPGRAVIDPFQVPHATPSIFTNWARTLPIMSKGTGKADITNTPTTEGHTPTEVDSSDPVRGGGASADIIMEVERLRREMDEIRNGRIQEIEPPPLYDFQNLSSVAEDHAAAAPST